MLELRKFLILAFAIIVSFVFIRACDVQATGPPLVIDPTYGKMVWESPDGKVKMYRIVDRVEGCIVVCYPLVGQLHGRTVSNFCISKRMGVFD
jgi:hypothetical protein